MAKRKTEVQKQATKNKIWRRWYNKNKNEFNEDRRVKYHTDEQYREKLLEQNREYKRRKRAEAKHVKQTQSDIQSGGQ